MEGRTQSLLILVGVGVGVAAMVFINAIMAGLEVNLLEKTLGAQAHITLTAERSRGQGIFGEEDATYARVSSAESNRSTRFEGWQRLVPRFDDNPVFTAVCPRLVGAAQVRRGAVRSGAVLIGADAHRLNDLTRIRERMVAGSFRLGSGEVLIGDSMSETLQARVGDAIRIGDEQQLVRIAGIFDFGSEGVDGSWVLGSLRSVQTLLDRPGDISEIGLRIDEPFEADNVAATLPEIPQVKIETWTERNGELLVALSSQGASSLMISAFVLLAVAMGIASVLIVSVVQRRGQIGILRAIGTPQAIVRRVFLWQGAMLGLGGAMLGVGLGTLAARGLASVALFDIPVTPALMGSAAGIALGIGLVSAFLPARQAAKMDPARAIQGAG